MPPNSPRSPLSPCARKELHTLMPAQIHHQRPDQRRHSATDMMAIPLFRHKNDNGEGESWVSRSDWVSVGTPQPPSFRAGPQPSAQLHPSPSTHTRTAATDIQYCFVTSLFCLRLSRSPSTLLPSVHTLQLCNPSRLCCSLQVWTAHLTATPTICLAGTGRFFKIQKFSPSIADRRTRGAPSGPVSVAVSFGS
jgi:hypothetical protein